jgi:hypothetical protein
MTGAYMVLSPVAHAPHNGRGGVSSKFTYIVSHRRQTVAYEADALLKIWYKRLFQAEGVTAFHILPGAEYDRMLPLAITPEPAAKPVRVGIALHPHVEIEPVLTEHVGALIRQLDSPRFVQRQAADKALLEIGPLAIAMLRAELKKGVPLPDQPTYSGLA